MTDQHVAEGAESLHADLAPLVCEKGILQSFVNHRVHFLQPGRQMTHDNEIQELMSEQLNRSNK